MTREQAAERVIKLRALADPARGGTPAERATASAKASLLAKRFGLDQAPRRDTRKKRVERVFVGGEFVDGSGSAWHFDVSTAEHSPNVRVRSYRNRGNWRIEVDL